MWKVQKVPHLLTHPRIKLKFINALMTSCTKMIALGTELPMEITPIQMLGSSEWNCLSWTNLRRFLNKVNHTSQQRQYYLVYPYILKTAQEWEYENTKQKLSSWLTPHSWVYARKLEVYVCWELHYFSGTCFVKNIT